MAWVIPLKIIGDFQETACGDNDAWRTPVAMPGSAQNSRNMKKININEVGVRDGFQIERDFIPTETKIAIIDQLTATGLAKIGFDGRFGSSASVIAR